MGRWSVMILTASAMLFGVSARPAAPPAAPIAEDVTITIAPGDSVLIPYAGSDPDGDLFGFFRTSDLNDPSAGFMFDSCVCRGTYAGFICSCTTVFIADAGFAGTATFTYRAVDLDGNESADATVTLISTAQPRTAERILDEIEAIVRRGAVEGGDIDVAWGPPLLEKVDQVRAALGGGPTPSAAGKATALCNHIDAGVRAGAIEEEAAGLLPERCGELESAILQIEPGGVNTGWEFTISTAYNHLEAGTAVWTEPRFVSMPNAAPDPEAKSLVTGSPQVLASVVLYGEASVKERREVGFGLGTVPGAEIEYMATLGLKHDLRGVAVGTCQGVKRTVRFKGMNATGEVSAVSDSPKALSAMAWAGLLEAKVRHYTVIKDDKIRVTGIDVGDIEFSFDPADFLATLLKAEPVLRVLVAFYNAATLTGPTGDPRSSVTIPLKDTGATDYKSPGDEPDFNMTWSTVGSLAARAVRDSAQFTSATGNVFHAFGPGAATRGTVRVQHNLERVEAETTHDSGDPRCQILVQVTKEPSTQAIDPTRGHVDTVWVFESAGVRRRVAIFSPFGEVDPAPFSQTNGFPDGLGVERARILAMSTAGGVSIDVELLTEGTKLLE